MSRERVLIVDDEPGIQESLAGVLEDEGYCPEAVGSGEECLTMLAKQPFPLVLLDIWLPGSDGLQTLTEIQKIAESERPTVVVISGHGNIETAVKATKLGAFDFLEKPLSIDKVVVVVKNALRRHALLRENAGLRREVGLRYRIIGESVPMKALRRQLELMAPTDGRVLIYGESGVGKELVAHAIHAQSRRAGEAFVEVNCAAIPEELIESELFGHIKGSFTGAHENKTGKFQQADGGTLFLDEIGDMSLNTQAKVLRVLEEQRFEPVGSGKTVQVNVRVIAATNKHLEEEIARGNSREDLFYRLNVIPFVVPPLRERVKDVALLADYLLEEFRTAYGRREISLSTEALSALERHSWPGNVRELRNLMERLVIMSPPGEIGVDRLPLGAERGDGSRAADSGRFPTLEEARKAYERDYVLRTIEAENGNMTRTAAVLGLERSHLYRKMKTLGIAAQAPRRGGDT